jgi:hypothetical protein
MESATLRGQAGDVVMMAAFAHAGDFCRRCGCAPGWPQLVASVRHGLAIAAQHHSLAQMRDNYSNASPDPYSLSACMLRSNVLK